MTHTITEQAELLPCPFCGAHAETDFIPEHHSYAIECHSIGCAARVIKETAEDAVEAWNRRAPASQALVPLSDALAEYDKVRDHVAEQVGCFDGGCLVKRPKGMHTNGGCKCSKNSIAAQRMMYAGQRLAEAVRGITQEKQG